MKYFASIVLSLLYLLPSVGLAISKHYCGGEISSVSCLPFHEHDCGCGEKEMDSDCCKDEFCFIKLEDSQQKTQNIQIPKNDFPPLLAGNFTNVLSSIGISCVNHFHFLNQPDSGFRQCLYKKYHAFLI
jgi:hypothetical protein